MIRDAPSAPVKEASSILVDRVSIAFDSSVVVDEATLEIESGEIVSLIGPSGCGKTTLLRTIAGLQLPQTGEVILTPEANGARGEIGFVFQQPALLPWATTLENVLLPLELANFESVESHRALAMESLAAVQLDGDANKRPHELSGGMQMRASIARALVTRPSVLLLDEPFAALDEMLRTELGELILQLWETRRFTAVMVTHNVGEAILMSQRIAVMRDGQIETVLQNPLPRPRSNAMMRTAEFASFYGVVSDQLRGIPSKQIVRTGRPQTAHSDSSGGAK